jgi:hypothetical protein
MPKLRRRPEKLLEVAYASGRMNGLSPVKAISYGGDAITLAVALAVAHLRGVGEDGWPTQAEYAEHYEMTERSAQREWQRFRQVFGPDADPYALARALEDEMMPALQRLAQLEGKPVEGLDAAVSARVETFGAAALA